MTRGRAAGDDVADQPRDPAVRDHPVRSPDSVPPLATGPLGRQLAREIRWSFTRPYTWLTGLGVNLALSLVWLVEEPLRGRPHVDWAVIVGSYFAVFVLADITTTNLLGVDAVRVRLSLLRGVSLFRILLVKNLALVALVGLPTLVATGIITVYSENDHRLAVTLPGVAFPILTWLGVGNLVSVLLPVSARTLRRRWAERRQLRPTVRWLVAVALPYALLVAVDPVRKLPRLIGRHLQTVVPRTEASRGAVLTISGLVVWTLGTLLALAVAHARQIPFDDAR